MKKRHFQYSIVQKRSKGYLKIDNLNTGDYRLVVKKKTEIVQLNKLDNLQTKLIIKIP